MNTTGLRVPRPMGTTEKGLNHFKQNTDTTKQELIQHIINHYLTTNFTYCNKHYNIEQLSILLNIPMNIIMGQVHSYSTNIQDTMLDIGQPDTLRALLSLSFKYALEDRGRAIEQYSILAASQGGNYKPFISSEVTKALKLLMESGQAIGQLIPKSGGNTFNILNQPNGAQSPGQEGALTVDKAIMLIKDMNIQPLSLDASAKDAIYEVEGIDATPEVCALKQEGIDTSKEALNINKLTELGEDWHENHRAIEEGFDTEADEL